MANTSIRIRGTWALLLAAVLALALLAPLASTTRAGAAEPEPEVIRHSGTDRFATAAAISAATFAPGLATAYIATGEGFADALAGGALAAAEGSPILLVQRGAVPEPTAEELRRLRPGRIVVFGGATAVGDEVLDELADLTAGDVTRLSGPTRFATAAAISAAGFAPGVAVALVATGEGFADALAGGAAAAHQGAPILLVRRDGVPEETAEELARLQPGRIDVLGGPAAVSEATAEALDDQTGDLRRIFGQDRYATAAAISAAVFAETTTAFIATGEGFADALAGAPAAGRAGAPVLLTRPSCMPEVVRQEILRLAAPQLVVLGGTAAVSEQAAARQTCEELPLPTFEVDPAVQPAQPDLPPLADGEPRPLARVQDTLGNAVDFVQNELILVTDDRGALDAFLTRWDGTVLQEVPFEGQPTTYLVRIDPTLADASELAQDVRTIDPLSRGDHSASSETALQTLAAAADETTGGAVVGVSFLTQGQHHGKFVDGISTEAPSGPGGYTTNAFDWTYMSNGSVQDFGVPEAWRLLEAGGKLGRRIGIMVIDGGFAFSDIDFPHPFSGNGEPNEVDCSGGNACPWHGTQVAQTAGGSADNGWGAAGSGAPVAELAYHVNDGGALDLINGVVRAAILDMEVVNISSSGDFPAGLGWVASPLSAATLAARVAGTLVVASAGNDGRDVDAEDCFIACWEEDLRVPCESSGVLCVGGLAVNSMDKATDSAYGYADCGDDTCDVEIFGPYTVFMGTDPDSAANVARSKNGTSFSSPFVAGIAALVFAANPDYDDDDVLDTLLVTAKFSAHDRVGRVVDAEAAVRSALGPVGPIATIAQPAQNLTVQYGSQSVTLLGHVYDDDPGCCPVLWNDSLDGDVSNSRSSTLTFGQPGDHILRLTATAPDGSTATDAVLVRAVNSPPVPTIVEPAAGQGFFRNVTYTLRGEGSDPNQSFMPCEQLQWTSSMATDTGFGVPDCRPAVVFTTNGPRTLTLTATDERGTAVTRTVNVAVQDPPDAHEPYLAITNPDDDQMLNEEETYSLEAIVSPAANGGDITYQWFAQVKPNGAKTLIGTTNPAQWKPGDNYPGVCEQSATQLFLSLEAKDSWGTGTQVIDVSVFYGVC